MSRKARAAAARSTNPTVQQNDPTKTIGGSEKIYSDDQLIKAIIGASGNITKAARRLGCDRSTFYERLTPRQMDDARSQGYEVVVDVAEMALESLVAASVPSAVFFTLKTQGARRGWIEHRHVDHAGTIKTITDLLAEDEDDGIGDDAGDDS